MTCPLIASGGDQSWAVVVAQWRHAIACSRRRRTRDRLMARGRVRPLLVVASDPVGDRDAGMIKAEDQGLATPSRHGWPARYRSSPRKRRAAAPASASIKIRTCCASLNVVRAQARALIDRGRKAGQICVELKETRPWDDLYVRKSHEFHRRNGRFQDSLINWFEHDHDAGWNQCRVWSC
jgi:hypothetical protein